MQNPYMVQKAVKTCQMIILVGLACDDAITRAARGRQLTEPDRPSKTAVVVMDTSKSGRARFGYGSLQELELSTVLET